MVASYLMPTQYCPVCSKVLDAATPLSPGDPREPDVGDCTVCMECRSFLRFYPGLDRGRPALMLKLMSQEEIAELPPEMRSEMVRCRDLLRRIVEKENGN